MSVRKTIAYNTVFNALGRIWEALVGLVLTVYIVHRLGFHGYGLWSIVAVFTGYAALLDFGVSSAFTKYIAQHAARNDARALSAVVSTGLLFYLLLGAVLVAVGWPAIDFFINLVARWLAFLYPDRAAFYNNAAGLATVRTLFRGALLLFALTNCIAPFSSVPTGLQRMGVTNLLSVAASVLKLVATVLFLEAGFGVLGLLYTNAVVLTAFALSSVVIAFRLHPALRVGPRQVTWIALGDLFRFGWRAQIAKLSNLINFQTDRVVVLAVFGNLSLVGLYRAGEELASKVRQLPALVVSAMIPAASDLDTRDEQARLAELYLRSTKYIAVIAVPLTFYAMATADLLVRALFAGQEGLGEAAWVARLLLVGYLANLLPGPGMSIALGKGRAEMAMYAGLISTGCNLGLTVIFVLFARAIGLGQTATLYLIAAATALALLLSTTWFFLALRRHVAVPPGKLLRLSLGWPAVASLPGAAAGIAVAWWLLPVDGRLENLAGAVGVAAVFGPAYGFILRAAPYLDAFDVTFLEHTLHLGRLPGFRWLVGGKHHG